MLKTVTDFVESLSSDDRSCFVPYRLSGRFYLYVLKRSDKSVFYVGKGTGDRINDHEREARKGAKSKKCSTIRKEWANGKEIIKEKIAFFDNEEDAYDLEILLIAFFGRENLANLCEGGEGGARPGAGHPKMRGHVEQKMREAGLGWLGCAQKYIRVGRHPQEPSYWIAPCEVLNTGISRPSDGQSFKSLKEIEEFLDERM